MYVYQQDTLKEKWEGNQKKYKQFMARAKLKIVKLMNLTFKMAITHIALHLWTLLD
jgi:hypothetical protein